MTTEEPPRSEEAARHRQMVQEACSDQGLTIDEWRMDDSEHREEAVLGRWRVIADDEERGLFEGDEGELTCSVVGAERYRNERAYFALKPDEWDVGTEIGDPMENLEPA